MERRLAAILVADVAGFSALAGRDEEHAIRALKGHVSALDPVVGQHRGRIVKSTGDGFLAEFPSVVDAVACTDLMQRQMAERNRDEPDNRRLDFRMGVHVGDIVEDDGDILGDGVNIAARLEQLAPPGGIAVSGRVFEDITGKLDIAFDDHGLRDLKNIARPIHLYVLAPAAATPKRERPAPALPDKPSIAVLPFENLSADPEQEYFADGITEDIITSLSYLPGLFVIARNSSYAYKGRAVDVRTVSRELGVRYLLEGSVRRAGNRVRVTGQLIDAETGNHIWADQHHGTLDDIFELQDRITEAVVGAIAPQIQAAEIARAARKPPADLNAYDHYLKALAAFQRVDRPLVREHLDAALRLAPDYARAKALLASSTTLAIALNEPVDPQEVDRSTRLAREVLDDPSIDPESRARSGYALALIGGDFEGGQAQIDLALEESPNLVEACSSSALILAIQGDPMAAIALADRALRLSPLDPLAYRANVARSIAYLRLSEFEKTLDAAKRITKTARRVQNGLRYEVVSLVYLGRLEDARAVADRLLAIAPNFTISKYVSSVRQFPDHLTRIVIEGLRKAGLPE